MRFEAPDEAVPVVGDAGQLERVVMNLIGNAVNVRSRHLLGTEVRVVLPLMAAQRHRSARRAGQRSDS